MAVVAKNATTESADNYQQFSIYGSVAESASAGGAEGGHRAVLVGAMLFFGERLNIYQWTGVLLGMAFIWFGTR